MEPKITKDFYLLVIKPNRGTYYAYANYFQYGLIGTVLFDLHREGAIRLADSRLIATASANTGFLPFDRMLDIIAKRGRLKICSMLSRTSFRFRSLKKAIVAYLIDNKIVVPAKKHFLGIPYFRYFPADREKRMLLIRRLRDILLRNESPQPDEMYLLSLIHVTQIVRALSDQGAERRHMRRRLRELLRNGQPFHPQYSEIAEITKKIKWAIAAKNVAHNGAH
jgi:hypothetical protein